MAKYRQISSPLPFQNRIMHTIIDDADEETANQFEMSSNKFSNHFVSVGHTNNKLKDIGSSDMAVLSSHTQSMQNTTPSYTASNNFKQFKSPKI